MILGDLFFAIDGGLTRSGTRLDQCFDDFVDCLNRLDRDGVYTFTDPKSQAYVRLVRSGEEVRVQSDETTRLSDGPRTLKYQEFRARILAGLQQYRDQLVEAGHAHPETRRFAARLEAVEAS
jgi:hypothetical protein